jgi:hypothetical protein
MRNLRLLALVAPAFLLPVACEDSGSSSGGAFNPEAGPGFDAGSPEAGPTPDAAVDSFVPPQPKGVTVTVLDGTAAKKDVRVILHDATGAVTGEKLTDAAGKATLATAPSAITVLATRSSAAPSPVTFFSVADGDNLVVTVPTVIPEEPTIGNYSVSFDAASAPNTSTLTVTAGAGCANGGNDVNVPVVVGLFSGCVLPLNAVFAEARAATGVLNGFAFKKGVAKPALNATTNVGPLAFAAAGSTKLTASSRPANSSLSASLSAVANGAAFFAGNGSGALDDGGMTFATATGFAEAYQSFVHARSTAIGVNSETAFVRREATTAPASVTLPNFDFANALPLIGNAAAASATAGRPDITLTSAAPLTPADGGAVVLTWVTSTNATAEWTFVLPSSAAATFKAPALPADATAFVPTANVSVSSAVLFEATQLPGYTEVKTLPITAGSGFALIDSSRPLPIDGTLRLTAWSPALRRL